VDFVAAACLSIAILSFGLATRRRKGQPAGSSRLLDRLSTYYRRRLAAARIAGNPASYVAMAIIAPVALLAIGWQQSPVLGIFGAGAGLVLPRLYLAWLVHAQARRSEAAAPPLLQAIVAGLTASNTYLDALRHARRACNDPWIAEDLDFVIQRFVLNVPLGDSMAEVRAHVATRNLGLIWETLSICDANHLPTQAARTLLVELSSAVQFNVQLANEVRARSAGQRAQIWLLAVIVPGMYLYLRLVNPQLLSVLDETMLGRFVLFPLAAVLEVAGIALSFRIARFDA
jgi:Flp pilus assembly protein TadB